MGISKDLQTGVAAEVLAGRAEVREAARAAAKLAGGFSFKGGVAGYFKLSEVREAERGITFAVSALNGRQLLQFRVLDEQVEPGRTAVRVGIGDHLETQARGAFGVPVDRRRVAGFGSYVKRSWRNSADRKANRRG
jgi:hypothetical protein